MHPRRNGLALAALLVRAAFASPYLRPSSNWVGHEGTKDSPELWYHLTISAVLVLLGGVFAGWVMFQVYSNPLNPDPFSLTLGLMGLDDLHLRVLATSSENPREKRNAQKGSTCPSSIICPCAELIGHSSKFVKTRSALGTCCESCSRGHSWFDLKPWWIGPPTCQCGSSLLAIFQGYTETSILDCQRKSAHFSGQCCTFFKPMSCQILVHLAWI